MNEEFIEVSKDTSIEELVRLRDKGLLCVNANSSYYVKSVVRDILSQLGEIPDEYYLINKMCVMELWRNILLHKDICKRIVTKKGKRRGQPCWYFVAYIMSLMIARGIYSSSLIKLTEMMHGKRTLYAKNAMQPSYQLAGDEYVVVVKLIKEKRS